MATHFSILAWRIPARTEEPDGLQSMGSQRVDVTEQLTLRCMVLAWRSACATNNLSPSGAWSSHFQGGESRLAVGREPQLLTKWKAPWSCLTEWSQRKQDGSCRFSWPNFLSFRASYISSIQLLSHFQLFATPWTATHQASLSITNSCSLLKLMSIKSVMPSNHLILVVPTSSCLQSFPASGSFHVSQFFALGGQSIGVSASASVLPMTIQDWFPLGWTSWISLQSKGLSWVFSNTTVQKHQFFSTQLSLWSNSHIYTWPLEKL